MPNEHPNAVLAFDVYGTLIDPFHMEEHLRAAFREKAKDASELWRSKQIEYSFRRALMKKYQPFDVCTAQALRFVSAQLGIPLSEEAQAKLMAKYLQLPAYPDATARLKNAPRKASQSPRAPTEPRTPSAPRSITREFCRASAKLSA